MSEITDEELAILFAGIAVRDGKMAALQAVWERAQLAAKAELMADADIEWGIAYADNPKDTPVDPIRNPKAAEGIFGHYGQPGDRLVKRVTHGWETIEEK